MVSGKEKMNRQEKVKAEITIRKLTEPQDGFEYATVVDFGDEQGRIIKLYKTYDKALEYANESTNFLWGEDYKDELQ
mgnify:CR=1 FL=1